MKNIDRFLSSDLNEIQRAELKKMDNQIHSKSASWSEISWWHEFKIILLVKESQGFRW